MFLVRIPGITAASASRNQLPRVEAYITYFRAFSVSHGAFAVERNAQGNDRTSNRSRNQNHQKRDTQNRPGPRSPGSTKPNNGFRRDYSKSQGSFNAGAKPSAARSSFSRSPTGGPARGSIKGAALPPHKNKDQKQPNQKKFEEQEDRKHALKFIKKQKQHEMRKEKERERQHSEAIPNKRPNIALPKFISLTNLANVLKLRLGMLQEKMKDQGFTEVEHDRVIDGETAVLIADELGFDATVNDDEGLDLFPAALPEDLSSVPLRPPIVTIMGHVDHGKTTILDYLRKTSVAKGEHGGITQHIGAFSVRLPSVKDQDRNQICFLDTPGHSAFLNMRQRGANVTDIVVLVVAADDSVMPQTLEAIKHAKNSNVPLIVAINKIDKPEANADKVIADLAANDVDVEPYGGDTQVIPVSGKTGQGIDKLEEAILTLSELIDIRSPTDGPAEGWVLESHVKKGLGNVATVLVKRGTLSSGSAIVAGTKWCRVRMLKDDQGRTIKSAGPGTPVEVLGWKELPEAGDEVLQAGSEAIAKKVADNRIRREEQLSDSKVIAEINEQRRLMKIQQEKEALRQERIKLGLPVDDDFDSTDGQKTSSGPKKLNFIVKADVSGSAEAVTESIQGLGNDLIQAQVLQSGVGPVTDSDVTYADTAGAAVLAFNVTVPRDVQSKAARTKTDIVSHNVIYKLLEDVTSRLSDQLEPEIRHKVLAEASIRQVFEISMKKGKNLKIAGCKVTNGSLGRSDKVKVLRNKEVVYKGSFTSMKHHKDEVETAKKDTECGIAFDGWDKFEEGDMIQTYEELVLPRHL